MARVWNWQQWGKPHDLIHQSDLNGLIGKFGCPNQFRFKKEERATGGFTYENAGGKLAAGNAVHAVIHRVFRSPKATKSMLEPDGDDLLLPEFIARAFDEEFTREVNGRKVDWYKVDGDKWRADCLAMLGGLFNIMHKHVGEVVLAEAAFVYQIGGIWLTGAVDLIYRARLANGSVSERISFADWKTGKQRPHQFDLDHGWQSGIYGNALRSGWFIPYESVPRVEGERHRDTVERVCVHVAEAQAAFDDATIRNNAPTHSEDKSHLAAEVLRTGRVIAELKDKYNLQRFDEYPERIRYVHMQDLIPYTRKQKKKLVRPEELAWRGLESPESVQFEKGDDRGPAWYHVNRSESDTRRLTHLLKAVVGWVRFGRFPSAPGEMCSRCKFSGPCLTDGYEPIGEEKKRLTQIQTSLEGFDGFDDDD